MESCLYTGTIRHRRYEPVRHEFSYRLFMVYLDLAELEHVFRGRWLWRVEGRAPASFRRADHFGDPRVPLDQAVRDAVEARTGRRPEGPVRLLTHLRYFGHCFNPVSFAYCFEPDGRQVEAVLAEVTNTPWKERHLYVVPATARRPDGRLHHRSKKELHVSPFMGMDMEYVFHLTPPGEALRVHIGNLRGGRGVFDADLRLERRPITGASLAGALARFPAMTCRVVAAIHWQALRLAWKRVPFHPHPRPGRSPAHDPLDAV